MALIHEKLIAINKEIGAIGKERKNEQQGFKFRGIDDVMNELHSLFATHEVIILPNAKGFEVSERVNNKGTAIFAVRATIEYRFIASDGSSETCILIGEAMDSGDKGMNKALSVALKYALLQMFLIPTEDQKDPDAETHEVKPHPAPMTTDKRPVLTNDEFNRALAAINKADANSQAAYEFAINKRQMTKLQRNTLDAAFDKIS